MKKTLLLSSAARRLKNITQLLNWRETKNILSIDYELKELRIPEKSSIVVLAPHPDDDIFGVGGLIGSLSKKMCSIHIVYLCSGESGTVSGASDTNLSETRKKEAIAALVLLHGDTTIEFLNQPDGSLQVSAKIIEKLSSIFKNHKPDYIIAPWFGDNHEDHQTTFQIMRKSLLGISPDKILLYEVWTPLIPNRYIVIDDYIDAKIMAINEHTSQLSSRNYIDAIIGLNAYRAGMIGEGKYAECFIELTTKQFDTLCALY